MKAKSRQKSVGLPIEKGQELKPSYVDMVGAYRESEVKQKQLDLVEELRDQVKFLRYELRQAQQREVEMRRELLAVLRPGPSARVEAYRQAERQYQRPEAEVEERPLGEGVPWTQELYAHGALIPPEERLTPEEQAILDTARQREEEMIAEANARAEGYGKPLTAEAEPVTVGGEENEEKEIPV